MNRRAVPPPDDAEYVCGEPLDLLPEDDRVPHQDNPPPVILIPDPAPAKPTPTPPPETGPTN